MKTARSIIDWPKMPAGRIAIAAAGFGLAIVLLLATAGSGSTLLAMGVAAGSAVAGWFAATAFRADAASHQPIRPSIHGETAEHEQILSLRKAVETAAGGKRVRLNVLEIRQPELDAFLVARSVADRVLANGFEPDDATRRHDHRPGRTNPLQQSG